MLSNTRLINLDTNTTRLIPYRWQDFISPFLRELLQFGRRHKPPPKNGNHGSASPYPSIHHLSIDVGQVLAEMVVRNWKAHLRDTVERFRIKPLPTRIIPGKGGMAGELPCLPVMTHANRIRPPMRRIARNADSQQVLSRLFSVWAALPAIGFFSVSPAMF